MQIECCGGPGPVPLEMLARGDDDHPSPGVPAQQDPHRGKRKGGLSRSRWCHHEQVGTPRTPQDVEGGLVPAPRAKTSSHQMTGVEAPRELGGSPAWAPMNSIDNAAAMPSTPPPRRGRGGPCHGPRATDQYTERAARCAALRARNSGNATPKIPRRAGSRVRWKCRACVSCVSTDRSAFHSAHNPARLGEVLPLRWPCQDPNIRRARVTLPRVGPMSHR